MDAMSWIDAVKATKKLTVYSGNLSGSWAKIVTAAVPEFNKIAKAHGIGVSLVQLSDREFAKSGANIEYGIGNGAVEFEHDRTTYSGQFDGSAKHGLTLLASRDKKLEKVKTFLPAQPTIHTPSGTRAVGDKVRLVIVLHEFLHACGLTNSQHTPEGLFQASPAVVPGDTASGDQVQATRGSQNIKFMPPYTIADPAKTTLAEKWS